MIAAWFAILFTGRFPRGMFDFLVGVGRWTNRVIAYAHVLVTDQLPAVPPGRVGRPDGASAVIRRHRRSITALAVRIAI